MRYAGEISALSNLSPSMRRIDSRKDLSPRAGNFSPRSKKSVQIQTCRALYRFDLWGGERKNGSGVGRTKRGKGTKLSAVAHSAGLPVAIHMTSANPHEFTLVKETLCRRQDRATPRRIIGHLTYDSGILDRQLADLRIELIAPHCPSRTRPATQDGRALRRYQRRRMIARLFAWLYEFRRISSRNRNYLQNYLAPVELACVAVLLRNGLRCLR